MFEKYRYENNFWGISIQRTLVDIGDKKYLNNLENIKFDERDESVYILAFKNVDEMQIEIYKQLFNSFFIKSNLSLSELVHNFYKQFDVLKSEFEFNEYIGLISELSFILECQKRNLDILKYYQIQNDQYDFKFYDNSFLEIKKIRKSDKSILISYSQISKLKKDDLVVGVDLFFDSTSDDLKKIFNDITWENNETKFFVKEKIDNLYKNKFFSNFPKIDSSKSNFHYIEKKFLPKIENENNNLLIDAKFRIFALALNKSNEEFFVFLKEKINA